MNYNVKQMFQYKLLGMICGLLLFAFLGPFLFVEKVYAYAAGEKVASGYIGKDETNKVTWTVVANSGNPDTYSLIFSGEGEIYESYGAQDFPWNDYKPYITKLEVRNGITNVPGSVCYKYPKLTTVSLADSVKKIGSNAFYGCSNITTLEIPAGVTEIPECMCYECYGLISVTMPDGVTKIGNQAFSWCTNLIQINMPSKLETIASRAFFCCKKINDFTLPTTVKKIGKEAFYNCFAWSTQLTLPEGMTTIEQESFKYCKKLTKIVMPSTVTTIEKEAFLGDSAVAEIVLPEGVTTIEEGAFCNCGITTISLPSSIKTLGNNLFYGCDELKYAIIQGKVATLPEGLFYDCNALESVAFTSSVKTICEKAFMNCKSLANVYYIGVPSEFKVSVEQSEGDFNINYSASDRHYFSSFCDATCNDLNGSCAFSRVADELLAHKEFTYQSLPNGFHKVSCKECGAVTIEQETCSLVAEVNASIAGQCKSESNCTEKATYYKYCEKCLALSAETFSVGEAKGHQLKIVIDKVPGAGVKGAKHNECTVCGYKTASEVLSAEEYKQIQRDQNVIAENETFTDKKTKAKYKVIDVNALEVAYVGPSSKTVKTVAVSSAVVYKDKSFQVKKLEDKAFKGCSSLTKVTLPSETTKIGANAFDGCKKMKTITIKSTKLTSKSVSAKAFKGLSKNVTIKVPKKQLKAYKSLFKKKGFKGKVKA